MAIYSERGVHGQTVQEVAARIMSGVYPEGSTIDVPTLEADLGVSRTALREALKVLAAKGLVDARQKRGTFVRARSNWNLLDADIMKWQFTEHSNDGLLDDLHEVRRIMEPAGVRLAAERRTDDDLAALESALEAMTAADGEAAAAAAADLAFHRALLEATHNELLTRMDVVLQTGLAARDALVHGADPHDDPVPSHRRVFEAVREKDPNAAASAMSALLEKAFDDLKRARRGKARR